MNTKQPEAKLYELRTLKTGKRLSWHKDKKGGRWCKKFQGKIKYFGSANSKHDYARYKLALAKAEAFVEDHNRQVLLDKADSQQRSIDEQAAAKIAEILKEKDSQWATYWKDHGPALVDPVTGERSTEGLEPNPEQEDIARARWEKRRRQEQEAASAQSQEQGAVTGIHALLDLFLAATKQRQILTEKHPETLPRRKQLTQRSYQAIAYGIDALREYTDSRRLKKMPTGDSLEKLLYDYRQHHMDKLIKGECKKGTVTAKTRHLQPLFVWLYDHHHIDNLPRNLKDVSQQLPSDGGGNPVDIVHIQKVWKHASDRLRCFLILGLNCAMYTSEIAELRPWPA